MCETWAEEGECARNPAYMRERCKESCKACQGSVSEKFMNHMNHTNQKNHMNHMNHL